MSEPQIPLIIGLHGLQIMMVATSSRRGDSRMVANNIVSIAGISKSSLHLYQE